jgi:hypothetical protein
MKDLCLLGKDQKLLNTIYLHMMTVDPNAQAKNKKTDESLTTFTSQTPKT